MSMTKEQEEAIETVEGMVKSYIEADECGLSNNDFKNQIRAMQTVLNMLKEKDKKIEYYKKQKDYDDKFKHELLEQIRCLNLDKDEKDKQIDLMAKYISNLEIDEDICMKNIANTELCNEKYSNCKECIKQYFERKEKEC